MAKKQTSKTFGSMALTGTIFYESAKSIKNSFNLSPLQKKRINEFMVKKSKQKNQRAKKSKLKKKILEKYFKKKLASISLKRRRRIVTKVFDLSWVYNFIISIVSTRMKEFSYITHLRTLTKKIRNEKLEKKN